jgi:chlorobactene glucosyltransferase
MPHEGAVMIELHAKIILSILIVLYALFEWNLRVYRRFSRKPLPVYPKVSVLVPCRNEEKRLEENLRSLLTQDYPDFEVVVLDDNSTDRTPQILEALKHSEGGSRLKTLRGAPLPTGWQGKNFACHQLSQAALGEWLLFVDADTFHAPDMLKSAVQEAADRGAQMVSTFPRQVFASTGDELTVPLMFFILLSFLPMFFTDKKIPFARSAFSTGCGQFLLVRSDAYRAALGHAGVGARISEAPVLAARVKAAGFKIVLADGSRTTSCRMYAGWSEVYRGFSRSVFASMGGSIFALLFFVIVQTYVYHGPWMLLAWAAAAGSLTPAVSVTLGAAIVLPIWMRWRIHRRTGMSARWIWAHAVSIALYHVILINSFLQYRIFRNTSWKGRSYAAPSA